MRAAVRRPPNHGTEDPKVSSQKPATSSSSVRPPHVAPNASSSDPTSALKYRLSHATMSPASQGSRRLRPPLSSHEPAPDSSVRPPQVAPNASSSVSNPDVS